MQPITLKIHHQLSSTQSHNQAGDHMILHNKSTKQQEQEGTGPIVHKDGKQSPSHVAVYIKDPAVNV